LDTNLPGESVFAENVDAVTTGFSLEESNEIKRPLQGHIDSVTRTEISGWAWDPTKPNDRIRLILTKDGVAVGKGVARDERPGLILAGIGDGRHAFRIKLEPGALSDEEQTLHLKCAESDCPLPGSPILVPPALTFRGSHLEATASLGSEATVPNGLGATDSPTEWGYLDAIDVSGIEGWAVSPVSEDEILTMVLIVDGRHLFSVPCNRPRLSIRGREEKLCGFGIEMPRFLQDGRDHIIGFKTQGGDLIALRDSTGVHQEWVTTGKLITRNATEPSQSIFGHLDVVQKTGFSGWSYDSRNPGEPVVLELFVDGDLLSVVTCDRVSRHSPTVVETAPRLEFHFGIPDRYFDGKQHLAELRPLAAERRWFETDQGSGSACQFFQFEVSATTENALPTSSAGGSGEEKTRPIPKTYYKFFDQDFYQKQAGIVPNPILHYMKEGWRAGHNPHPLFDTIFYCFHARVAAHSDPLTHFFEYGQFHNAQIHPLFDNTLYYGRRPEIIKTKTHPALHYIAGGWKDTELPSEIFSDSYYENHCPGVRAAGMAPIIHYLTTGFMEGRKPHSEFDPKIFARVDGSSLVGEPLSAFMRSTLIDNHTPKQPSTARVSIIILNLEKSLMTLQCLYFLRKNTDLDQVEIIVLDNGSSPSRFALLCKYALGCRIIRLGTNRGFGEGNNIAVEQAQGEILVFLNNDAFVGPQWLETLESVLRSDPSIGAVGPRFVYPDGSLQEAGAMIGPDGTAVQRGKHLDPRDPLFNRQEDVDYCSAATLMLWKEAFLSVLGYDLCWDPAYYEDADLSLKLRLIGKRTVYVPTVEVVHLENARSSDQNLDLRLHNVVRANRMKFVSRWGQMLSGYTDDVRTDLTAHFVEPQPFDRQKTMALYTPYPLTPGGGERYLLSLAAALKDHFNCVLMTDEPYSRLRLLTLGRELNVDVKHVQLALWSEFHEREPLDLFICMGNEILPPVHPRSRLSYYHCQFPFPLQDGHFVRDWSKLAGYRGVIVNSQFTARHVLLQGQALAISTPPITVLYPPVPQIQRDGGADGARGAGRILHVGRFAPGGHCKRQDVLIDIFQKLLKCHADGIELHFAGALGGGSEDRKYFLALQDAARGLPIQFHVNISPRKLHDLYRSCSIYWHVTGILNDQDFEPEKLEHFGITIGEAMSGGLIPIVFRFGGPSEIVTDTLNGYLIESLDELKTRTLSILDLLPDSEAAMRMNAARRAERFSFGNFKRELVAHISAGKECWSNYEDISHSTALSAGRNQASAGQALPHR
jgi:GT2 family glycosyltransferase/glycosyltransferase involved in cell wall biosynthesis